MIFSAEQLAEGTGGTLVSAGPNGPVVTDSRRIRPGDWFLCLAGDRFDAHDFLPMAGRAGCAGAIGQRVPDGWQHGFVRVDDGLEALQNLARYVRGRFSGQVVGLTGSAGKTTTRAMIALVAEARGKVHQTEGNLNNHIGVPLTLLAAPVDADLWVIEMGMSGFGEIDLLQEIARPTVRLITNVGAAHLEGVGSIEGVARAKGELFAGANPGDVCCVNVDDPQVAKIPLPDGVRVIRYGTQNDCDVRLTDAAVDARTLVTRYRIEAADAVVRGTLDSPGIHLAHNACAAVAVGMALRCPLEPMGPALSRYTPVGMRLRIEDGPLGTRVINDAYNANPISVAASLRTLAGLSDVRRVAILGDMLELGADEIAEHRHVLELASGLGLDGIFVAGPRFCEAAEGMNVIARPDAESLAPSLRDQLRSGDVVLVKGSRGMAMERVLQRLGDA